MDPLRVLFVCTGNICRSPMAEGLARHHARQRGLALSCASVGLIARDGMPATEHGVITLAAKGIDIGGHRARRLGGAEVDWADLVVAMEEEHRLAVREFPEAKAKPVVLLSEWAGEPALGPGIADPIGGSAADYAKTADEIERYIERALARL
jgi:protein-tyrosine-phosphatase